MLKARLGAHVLCETVGCSGAAFSLVKPARKSDAIAFDGWVVEVTKGETLVVARGGSETNSRDAYEQALCKSQKGLDILSLNGDNSLLIKDASDSNVVWHASSDGLIIKITTTRTTSIETTLEITSTDADGNVVPRLPRSTLWHESFRYYRLSQATDDLFDGYRNVYLALESVLSSIAPQYLRNGKVNEGEGHGSGGPLVLQAASSILIPLFRRLRLMLLTFCLKNYFNKCARLCRMRKVVEKYFYRRANRNDGP